MKGKSILTLYISVCILFLSTNCLCLGLYHKVDTTYSDIHNEIQNLKTIHEQHLLIDHKGDFIDYDIPDIKTFFKTYMDYRTITNKSSKQWEMQQNAKTDEFGLRTYDDMYMVALGTYYTQKCGEIFNITFDNGYTIKCITGDIKSDAHTDSLKQHRNGNVVEFIVDTNKLDSLPKKMGDISWCHDKFKGNITKIQKILD